MQLDSWTVIALFGLVFGVIVIAAVLRYRGRIKAGIRGPGGTGLELEAENPPPARGGARIEGTKAGRDITAKDATGQSAVVKNSEAGGDVTATVSPDKTGPKKA